MTQMTRENVYDKKLRVLAYCRVSSLEDAQINSLRQQREYFEKFVNENPNWELVDILYDEGITGTNVKKRDGFKRAISMGENKEYDLLITKEISRFSRSVCDTLMYVRHLQKFDIECLFIIDNIYTGDPDAMLRLQIMSSIAENEILKISQRVRFGHRKNFEDGKVYGAYVYGYHLNNCKLTINPETAKIVQKIYDLFLYNGMGYRAIKAELEKEQIPSPLGKDKWCVSTIKNILQSEKYKGCLVQQKWITLDHLEKKRIRNNGKEEFVVIENSHEPIIDKDQWDKVQEEIQRRKDFYKHKTNNLKGKYSAKYAYSSRIICANCGMTYKRKIWNKHKNGEYTHAWGCSNMYENGVRTCNSKSIPEYIFDELMKNIVKDIYMDKEKVLKSIEVALNTVISKHDNKHDINTIQKQLDKLNKKSSSLLDLMLEGVIDKETYKKKKIEIDKDIEIKQKLLNNYVDKENEIENIKMQISNMYKIFSNEMNFENKETIDEITRCIVKNIKVYNKNHFEVILTTGISKTVEYKNNQFYLQSFDSIGMHGTQQKMVAIIPILEKQYNLSNTISPNVSRQYCHYDNIKVKLLLVA